MKKTVKLISILLFVAMISISLTTVVSASGIDAANLANQLKGNTSAAQEDVVNIGNQIIGIITTVGVVVAVVILLVLGIKYMMGSASEKAEYKKTMIPYLIGVVLLVAITQFIGLIANIVSNIDV